MKIFYICFIVAAFTTTITAQIAESEMEDSLSVNQSESFLQIVEGTLEDYYRSFSSDEWQTDSIINAFGHDYDDIPAFSDSVYCMRLNELNNKSPFKLDCNDINLKNIKFFAENRRNFVSVVLGRSKLYFNMFEEKLAKNNLPLELKYLAVIESGLRPQVKSRAGALGLWQFMYRTGKLMGLDQNSYIDERMDPELATEAACKYLKHLYDLYKDWNLVLAAYNAGPGNVNKAIRRSGGKMNYWDIRTFLPRETQGYVPNFVAMSYLMTYHAEHNIRLREPKYHDFEIDTVCLKKSIHIASIDSLISWSADEIKLLNPIFKTSYLQKTPEKKQCLQIPTTYIKQWIAFEDSLYVLDSIMYQSSPINIKTQKEQDIIVHYVKSGQTLGHLARRYRTTVNNIMTWNNLRTTNLAVGQKLKIYTNDKDIVRNSNSTPTQELGSKILHTINPGDSLWTIAKNNETTVEELKRLNPDVNYLDLKVGQQIRIK